VHKITTSILYWARLLMTIPRYDTVHIFSASYLSFLIAPAPALIITKPFGRRIVLNCHSGEVEDHLRRRPRTCMLLLKLAEEIIVPSLYLVRVFSQFGPKVEAIFSVIDFERLTFRQRDTLRPASLLNGNFEAHYGVDLVLCPSATIQQRFEDASLMVVGDGPCQASLENLAACLRLRDVGFVGRVEREQMAELYNQSDWFLNGSRIDNQPLSLLGSLAGGLPIATTDAGRIPDW
jgi:L-malate glycosyltransferase